MCICLCDGYAGAGGTCYIGWCAGDHAPPSGKHALVLECVCECVSVFVVGMLVPVVHAILDGVLETTHHLRVGIHIITHTHTHTPYPSYIHTTFRWACACVCVYVNVYL